MHPSHRAVISIALLASACGRGGPATAPATSAPSPTGQPTTSAIPFATEPDARITREVEVAAQPRGLALHDGRIWVASARADQLTAIDPMTGSILADIVTGPTPVSVVTLDGSLWVSIVNRGQMGVDQGVARVDTDAGTVDPLISVPVFHNVASTSGALWALDDDGRLQRIDPRTADVTSIDVGPGTQAIAANASGVWGAKTDGSLWRVDAASNTVVASTDLDQAIGGRTRLAVVEDSLWVGTPGAVLVRDASTLEPVSRVDLDWLEFVNDVEASGDVVWVAATTRLPADPSTWAVALAFDRESHELVDSITFGREAGELEIEAGTMWAADQAGNRVVRIALR